MGSAAASPVRKDSPMEPSRRGGTERRSCWPVTSSAVKFAVDSLLEGDGFEPSVPVAREPVYIAEGELRGDLRAAIKFLTGYRWFESLPLRDQKATGTLTL